MNDDSPVWVRLATIVALIESSPNKVLGRTAVVKLPYILQVMRGLPLGYDFHLYTYGPYDSDVLSDLGLAQSLEAVTVKTVLNPVGYGYEIQVGPNAEWVKKKATSWLEANL